MVRAERLIGGQCGTPVSGEITAKLAGTPQVDEQCLQADTGSLKFTQPAVPVG